MIDKEMTLLDEDGGQYITQKLLWRAKNEEAYLTTDGHIAVLYHAPEDLRDVYLSRFIRLLIHDLLHLYFCQKRFFPYRIQDISQHQKEYASLER